jgi:4-amino-4-deoxy-L-arabinose transferase-like glycosyltransferase
MITSGDWGHTTLQGVNRFDKPIGVYWLQAASVQIFGLHEWALRLPSVLACWISALALGRFAWQLWGLPAGVMAVAGAEGPGLSAAKKRTLARVARLESDSGRMSDG